MRDRSFQNPNHLCYMTCIILQDNSPGTFHSFSSLFYKAKLKYSGNAKFTVQKLHLLDAKDWWNYHPSPEWYITNGQVRSRNFWRVWDHRKVDLSEQGLLWRYIRYILTIGLQDFSNLGVFSSTEQQPKTVTFIFKSTIIEFAIFLLHVPQSTQLSSCGPCASLIRESFMHCLNK